MSEVIALGKTVDEALDNGCSKLNIDRAKARFVILQQPKKGFLGLFGSRQASVKVEAVNLEEEITSFLEKAMEKMGFDVTVKSSGSQSELFFSLEGDQLSYLIGKGGQTLDSIQHFITRVFATELKKYRMRITLDANGYRKRKEAFIRGLAERMGELVRRNRKKIVLDPMPSNERKLVHHTLQKHSNLRTESVGVEPERSVVIHWK